MAKAGVYSWSDTTPISSLRAHCFDKDANGVDVRLTPATVGPAGETSFHVPVPEGGACAVVR